MKPRKYSIHSLEAALSVVECFLDSYSDGLGVTEISNLTGFSKSRVFRILDTLSHRGYIQKIEKSQRYKIGVACLAIGEAFRDQLDIRKAAEPILEDLAEKSGDTALLIMLIDHKAVIIEIKQGKYYLQSTDTVGQTVPFHVGASPRVLLAHMPESDRSKVVRSINFEKFTPRTTANPKDLEKRLEQIRSQGYCLTEDDYEVGVYAVGAPVRDDEGNVVAGISLITPQVRFTKDCQLRNVRLVVEAADELSMQLGYRFTGVNSNETSQSEVSCPSPVNSHEEVIAHEPR